jgi:hexosaminidase
MNNLLFFLTGLTLLCLSFAGCDQANEPASIHIIPQPLELEVNRGSFHFEEGLKIRVNSNDLMVRKTAIRLGHELGSATGIKVGVEGYDGTSAGNDILLTIDENTEARTGAEGYLLDVRDDRITITAAHPAGIFYGIQTLFQLMPAAIYTEDIPLASQPPGEIDSPPPDEIDSIPPGEIDWSVPCVQVYDKPRYSWRGMHLDVSRHFFPVSFIKKYIDLIAMHKMNIFHWHLTDDNGWRIEIKKYPLLTEVSAWRVDREDQPWRERTAPLPGEKATYGGYYTQEEIREVIDYAANRFITIIPEIEMPGHTSEVFAAYPELSCRGKSLYVQPGSYWPNEDIFCAGRKKTYMFIEDVLAEVAGLFPSPYIHIGGDEANKARWEECPHCQQRIKDESLQDEDELQSYFIRRVERFLKSKDKKLIGWDEILEGGLAPDATVMSWRGFKGGLAASEMGHDVIMCPTSHCYFDYYQADPETQPVAIGGYLPLSKVYAFNPVPPGLTNEQAGHVLGGQGNVWTEFIPTTTHAEYMALPRMTALAEVLWSDKDHIHWNDFLLRLESQHLRFDAKNVNYYKGPYLSQEAINKKETK